MNWTEGRIKGFITSTLRAGFRRWPAKYEALNNSFVGKKENPKTGREAKMYMCNSCKNEFSSKDVQVDHIEPVVDPVIGFKDWDTFIDRLYCSVEKLQVLCLTCHKEKTKEEKQIRKANGS